MRRLFFFGAAAVVLGCSSPQETGDAGPDAAAPVNGCTTYEDDTASGATVNGPTTAAPAQYSPACVHVKVGQSVTFTSAFSAHPLEPFGGDSPSPIQATSTGTTVAFTFSQAGTFGFHCMAHPATMQGAVEVTP